MKPREKFFCGYGIFTRVQSGAAQRFHSNEDGSVWRENFQRFPDEILGVVILATAEVPVVADPGQGLGLSNFNGVANERRTCMRNNRETQEGQDESDSKAHGNNLVQSHLFQNRS